MSMTFDEVQQVWARKQFDYRGMNYKDDDSFDIESAIIYGGYCETCSYESSGYRIRNNRTGKSVEVELYFSDFMRQLDEISREHTE